MKIVMFLLMTLALVGCTDLYDRRNHSYFRRFSENLTVDEQMRIKAMLESNGYTNIVFGWDCGVVVVADLREYAPPELKEEIAEIKRRLHIHDNYIRDFKWLHKGDYEDLTDKEDK